MRGKRRGRVASSPATLDLDYHTNPLVCSSYGVRNLPRELCTRLGVTDKRAHR